MTITEKPATPEIHVPELPDGYSIRPIEKTDFNKGALTTLAALTTVGDVNKQEFEQVVHTWDSHSDTYRNLVIVDDNDTVVGIGSLLIELKLIHGCSKVGHIEDIAIMPDQQGKKLGLILIRSLIKIGKASGCYKIILDCDPKNQGFYEKCGFKKAGLEMDYRF